MTKTKEVIKTRGIIAVDNGGDNVKVLAEGMESPVIFKSAKSKGSRKDLSDPILSPEFHSHVVEWNGNFYLTNYRTAQSKFAMTGFKESKTDDFFILSILIAVAQYGFEENLLCTCVPYYTYKKSEVEKLREILVKDHTISIDKIEYNFTINDILVAVEAQSGHFYLQREGEVTLLEIGSRTVGYATNKLIKSKDGGNDINIPIREKTGTISRKGIQIGNLAEEDIVDYANSVYADLSSIIDEKDKIVAFGGGVMIPKVKETLNEVFESIEFAEDPLFVQVRGMLAMAEQFFSEGDGE